MPRADILLKSKTTKIYNTKRESLKQNWTDLLFPWCPWLLSSHSCCSQWSCWWGTPASCRPSPGCQSGRPSEPGKGQQHPVDFKEMRNEKIDECPQINCKILPLCFSPDFLLILWILLHFMHTGNINKLDISFNSPKLLWPFYQTLG